MLGKQAEEKKNNHTQREQMISVLFFFLLWGQLNAVCDVLRTCYLCPVCVHLNIFQEPWINLYQFKFFDRGNIGQSSFHRFHFIWFYQLFRFYFRMSKIGPGILWLSWPAFVLILQVLKLPKTWFSFCSIAMRVQLYIFKSNWNECFVRTVDFDFKGIFA